MRCWIRVCVCVWCSVVWCGMAWKRARAVTVVQMWPLGSRNNTCCHVRRSRAPVASTRRASTARVALTVVLLADLLSSSFSPLGARTAPQSSDVSLRNRAMLPRIRPCVSVRCTPHGAPAAVCRPPPAAANRSASALLGCLRRPPAAIPLRPASSSSSPSAAAAARAAFSRPSLDLNLASKLASSSPASVAELQRSPEVRAPQTCPLCVVSCGVCLAGARRTSGVRSGDGGRQ